MLGKLLAWQKDDAILLPTDNEWRDLRHWPQRRPIGDGRLNEGLRSVQAMNVRMWQGGSVNVSKRGRVQPLD